MMRLICMALGFLLLAAVYETHAYGRPNLQNIDKPILLDAGPYKSMDVIFNHSSHKNVPCRQCHHVGLSGNRYASCTNAECHSIPQASSRSKLSIYMAYHAPDTSRSCLGCHKQKAAAHPEFKGCAPCHRTPYVREMLQKARAGQER